MGKSKKEKKHEAKASREPKRPGEKCPIPLEGIKNGLKNGAVQCKPKRVPKVPPHLPALPLLAGGFGVCKSGKSNAFVNLIQEYCNYGSINMLFCISPTYDSNASLQTLPFVDEVKQGNKKGFRGIFTDSRNSVTALKTILNYIKDKNVEYIEEKEYKKIYAIYSKGLKHTLTWKQMDLLGNENYREPENIPWPQPGIFIDDMTHTELMSNTINNELSHLSLHHRHLEGVGISIFQAFQTFKSGMPKVVRTNISLILLFPTTNMKEIEEIYQEVSNNISFETFKKLLFEATKETHGFLLINKMADDPRKQFGLNFDQVFIVDPVEERRKILYGDPKD